jgi:hypothetical protein
MDKNRIPYALARFNSYIRSVDTFLHALSSDGLTTNGIKLDMTNGELVKLNDFRYQWSSDDPLHPGIYDLHLNPNTKTSTTRATIDKLMSDFRIFFRPVLTRISVSRNINTEIRQVLRIAAPVTERTRHQTPITESCVIYDTPIGGSMIKISCRTAHDSNRASIAALANAVEVAYGIHIPLFDEKGNHINQNPLLQTNCKDRFISTKATFMLEFGIENTCKFVTLYARWINTKHAELAGHWTGPFRAVIC